MRRAEVWLGLGLAGCAPNFESLDEACLDVLPGERHLQVPSVLLDRITCYRRFVGLAPGKITRGAQRAAASHASYLEINDIVDEDVSSEELFNEDPNLAGFTGITVWDRLEDAGAIDTESTVGIGIWNVFLSDVTEVDPDEHLADPYFRDVAFQPLWIGAGYAELDTVLGDTAGYMNMTYAFPPGRRIYNPVVYPKDGQTEVPLAWVPYGHASDPMSAQTIVGYPITITVGSDTVTGGTNPFELRVLSATLTGGRQGSIPLIEVLPGSYPWGQMQATVILAPVVPLFPDVEFTLEAEIEWNIHKRKISTTFTTRSDDGDTDLSF
jgi:hypothetical protein